MPAVRLGVIFHPAFAPEALPDYARRAEAAGFDELWLWDDCFLPGAFTSAAVALASTQRIKVGIGLLPVVAYNPLFMAMEITTLARLYPGRFIAGFGHGVESWMKQIGAFPDSPLRALEETVYAVRQLLRGEVVTMHGSHVHLDKVKMTIYPDPEVQPPFYVGAMREKTLQLSGRVADGAILPAMASPAYVRWAKSHVEQPGQMAVYVMAKVSPDGYAACSAVRPIIAAQFWWAKPQLLPLNIHEQALALINDYGVEGTAERMPDEWVHELAAAGTPEQAADTIHRLHEAGADSVILQPLDNDPGCLDEYARYLMPTFISSTQNDRKA
jgi:5,10-methylenetetrahydromethanopterin reductase